MRSWWWFAILLAVASIAAALTLLGKVPGLPGWMATGLALLVGVTTKMMSDVVGARLRWRVERAPTTASALRNGFLLAPRGRIPHIADIDAVTLGVHPAAQVTKAGKTTLPPYVVRDLDAELDELLHRGGLVLVEGQSAAGKTRTAVEAMRRALAGRRLLVPQDGPALRALVESGTPLRRAVIWLDDLERFLASGELDAQLVSRMCPAGRPDVLLLGTIRSQARLDLISAQSPAEVALARTAVEVLSMATTRTLRRQLSAGELRRADALRSDERIAEALDRRDEVGFAEYLCAGPAIRARWLCGRNADRVAVVGAALVTAAVDCRRAGCESPVPRAVLAELYSHYLDSRVAHHPGRPSVDDGLNWAAEPVRGASSCLVPHSGDRYLAFDYLVELPGDAPETGLNEPIPDPVWEALAAHLDPQELNIVGLAAFRAGQDDFGSRILARWAESSDDPATWCFVGTYLLWRGPASTWDQRSAEAEPWLVRAANAGNPNAARQLAKLFDARGDSVAAERWAQHGAEAGDAYAMVYLGELLEERGNFAAAEQWYRRAIASGPVEAQRVPLSDRSGPIDVPPLSFQFGKIAGDYAELECAPLTATTHLGLLHARRGEEAEAELLLRGAASYGQMGDLMALGAFLSARGDLQRLGQWCNQAAEAGRLDAIVELGATLAESGETLHAQRVLSYAADAGRSDAAIYLGQLAQTVGDYTHAEHLFRAAETDRPEEAKDYLAGLHRLRPQAAKQRNRPQFRPPKP